jgi:hypothetical protein
MLSAVRCHLTFIVMLNVTMMSVVVPQVGVPYHDIDLIVLGYLCAVNEPLSLFHRKMIVRSVLNRGPSHKA